MIGFWLSFAVGTVLGYFVFAVLLDRWQARRRQRRREWWQ